MIIFVSIVFGCFVGLMYVAHGWGEAFNWTTDSVEQVIPSPNGDYIAYVYSIRGAMVSYSFDGASRSVIILRPRSAPAFIKNDHIMERSNWWGGAVNDVIFRGYLTDSTWLSNDHLLIESVTQPSTCENDYDECGEGSWEDVKISYKPPKETP
jgi:hypothetical protein